MPTFDAADLSTADAYALLTSLVVPRPIAWVGTRSREGVDNLAPHSYFTVVSSDPPIVVFVSVGTKDTLSNVRDTGVFTISVVSRPQLVAMNATAARVPPDVDEFDHVDLARAAATTIEAPLVAGAPASLECDVHDVREVGDGTMVFGAVRHVTVADRVWRDGAVDMGRLEPVGRLAASQYAPLGEIIALDRPTTEYGG